MDLSDDVIRDLEELFRTVERGTERGDPDKGAFMLVGTHPNTLLFQGRSEFLLHDLERRLARSALEHGGPSPEAVRTALIDATSRTGKAGPAEAIAGLAETLNSPLIGWEFAEEIVTMLREGSIPVGACEVFAEVPDRFLSVPEDRERFRGGSAIATLVQARDRDSALQIANERFEEARAILALATRRTLQLERSYATSQPQRGLSLSAGPLFSVPDLDYDGNLGYELAYLSDAASRLQRTDWERRVLAAARWSMRARLSRWPAERLMASMVALETIFIPHNHRGPKKYLVAQGATAHARLYGKSCAEQEDWLRELYERRNDVAHEGQDFLRDLEIDRLLDVVLASVGWAARHVWPWHRKEGKPCLTFDEAMSPHP